MKVTVLKNGQTTDYYFDPEHYLRAYESYKAMQESGEIESFSITVTSK
jgi:hypothetical protein